MAAFSHRRIDTAKRSDDAEMEVELKEVKEEEEEEEEERSGKRIIIDLAAHFIHRGRQPFLFFFSLFSTSFPPALCNAKLHVARAAFTPRRPIYLYTREGYVAFGGCPF